jgi:cytochrome oxidase Cu insertion factor (SCO1/SenC/PrrC family)
MEVKESSSAPSAPLDFAAEQLDGNPFKLVSLRGKPAVVVFWGMWAPGSLAKLEGIQAAVAKLEERPALVTVNLDSSNESAREGAKSLGAGWVHTRLAGEALYEVTERLNVDTLPVVLLLDAQGRVRGRDVDGKRLASSVKRMAASKN